MKLKWSSTPQLHFATRTVQLRAERRGSVATVATLTGRDGHGVEVGGEGDGAARGEGGRLTSVEDAGGSAESDRTVNCEAKRISEHLFMRICADLRSIIYHPAVATELLAERELLHLVTHVLAGLQSANAQRRNLGRHVE